MAEQPWAELRERLEGLCNDYAGKIEYGNLRLEVYDGDGTDQADRRIAMAYETPGGSTNQFGLSYEENTFVMLDAAAEVVRVADPGEVTERMRGLIDGIPQARAGRLRQDIDQMLADGATRLQVLEELNRLLRLGTEFRGGSLTVGELTAACRYLAERAGGAAGG